MGERLIFRSAGLTSKQANEGGTAYQAEAAGVQYRVEGTIVDPVLRARRVFRAYRVGESGRLVPAARGGAHRTRAAAFAQCEADLIDVLSGRSSAPIAQHAFPPADYGMPCQVADCGLPYASGAHHDPREACNR